MSNRHARLRALLRYKSTADTCQGDASEELLKWALARDERLSEHARDGDHRKATILNLLELQRPAQGRGGGRGRGRGDGGRETGAQSWRAEG